MKMRLNHRLVEDIYRRRIEELRKCLDEEGIYIPPCLQPLEEKASSSSLYSYLRTVYPRFFESNKEPLMELYTLSRAIEGNEAAMELSDFERWKCPGTCNSEEKRECSNHLSWDQRIIFSIDKIRKIKKADGSSYCEIILTDGNSFTIDPQSESLSRDLRSVLFSIFGRLYYIDLRRKADREAAQHLFDFISQNVTEEIDEESEIIDSDVQRLKEAAFTILYSVELNDDEKIVKEGTIMREYRMAFFKEGLAHYPRNSLLAQLELMNIRISPTKLSHILTANGVHITRKRIGGVRHTFYVFKPTEEQIEEFEKVKRQRLEEQSEGEGE